MLDGQIVDSWGAAEQLLIFIAIHGTGNGLPEAIQSRIFDHFFTTREVRKGSGRGLPIAYRIVCRKHGGKISFDTKRVGGRNFTVALPNDHD